MSDPTSVPATESAVRHSQPTGEDIQGLVATEQLGVTLMHEHILHDIASRPFVKADGCAGLRLHPQRLRARLLETGASREETTMVLVDNPRRLLSRPYQSGDGS